MSSEKRFLKPILISVFFLLSLRLIAVMLAILIAHEGLHGINTSGYFFLAGFLLTVIFFVLPWPKFSAYFKKYSCPVMSFLVIGVNAAGGIMSLAQAILLL